MTLKSILVAVRDPSDNTQVALRKAAQIAQRCGASLTLYHAFANPSPLPEPLPTDPTKILEAFGKARREALRALARPLRAKGLRVRCEVAWDFPPAHAIVRRVLIDKPDLVVAASHRHSRIARWFLNNSDWELIRECPCPVWFVKDARLSKRPRVLTAVDPTHARAKPAGLDNRLVRAARDIGGCIGGELALIHVAEPDGARWPFDAPVNASSQRVSVAAIERLAQRHGVTARALLESGNPADALIDAAAKQRADLLVMGAVSRSSRGRAHIGGTAESVIDAVECDVLVVKPRGFATSVTRKVPRLAH
jgi:universal stress protein E